MILVLIDYIVNIIYMNLNTMNINNLDIYTDGSLIKKNEQIKTGYGIYFPNKEYNNISGKLLVNDIHYAEMFAIKQAMKIMSKDIDKYDKISFYTDSYHCIKKINKWYDCYKNNKIEDMITKKNKDIKNKEMLLEIFKLIKNKVDKFNFIHIKSHSGKKDDYCMNNRIVDKLARLGTTINI